MKHPLIKALPPKVMTIGDVPFRFGGTGSGKIKTI